MEPDGKIDEKFWAALSSWTDYPRHLAGRLFSVVVHDDVEGAENVRRSISDWLRFMKLAPAGPAAELNRYIGDWKPYATSHEELDRDKDVQEGVRNATLCLAEGIMEQRAGRFKVVGLARRSFVPRSSPSPPLSAVVCGVQEF